MQKVGQTIFHTSVYQIRNFFRFLVLDWWLATPQLPQNTTGCHRSTGYRIFRQKAEDPPILLEGRYIFTKKN